MAPPVVYRFGLIADLVRVDTEAVGLVLEDAARHALVLSCVRAAPRGPTDA
jgi:hypothetical protein